MTKRNIIGLVVLCSVMLTASACGKKKGDKAGKDGGKMGAAGLVGTWKLNGKKIVSANEMFNMAPKAQQDKFAEMMNKGTMTITKDTMVMKGLGPEQTDKYKVVEDKGKIVVVESVDKKGKKETATYTFLSATEIKVVAKDKGKEMIFFANRQ